LAVAPTNDLRHAGKVVLPLHSPDPIAPIKVVGWLAVDEAHHARNDVRGADVGDVKTLHSMHWPAKLQSFGERLDIRGGIDPRTDTADG